MTANVNLCIEGESHPLVPLGLCEVCGEAQFGDEGQGFSDSEVRQEPVVLPYMGDALLHQLGRVGLPINQNLTRLYRTTLIPARYYVQQRGFTTA